MMKSDIINVSNEREVNKMAKFVVWETYSYAVGYLVEANSKEEAKELFEDGEDWNEYGVSDTYRMIEEIEKIED